MSHRPLPQSNEEISHRLLNVLQSKGVADSLKKQVRTFIVNELRASAIPGQKGKNTKEKSGVVSLHEQAARLVVLDFLNFHECASTASVFVPEIGCNTTTCARDEILQLCGCEEESISYKRLIESPGPLLTSICNFVSEKTRLHRNAIGVQTDVESLEIRLRQIDNSFLMKMEEEKVIPIKSIEEKMEAWRREADARARIEINEEIERFRKIDLSRIRLEENARLSAEMEETRRGMAHAHDQKIKLLQLREDEIHRNLEAREKEFDQHCYQHRQRMLGEIESFRNREIELKAQIDMSNLTIKKEEQRLKSLERDLAQREKEIENKKNEMFRRVEVDAANMKLAMSETLGENKNKILNLSEQLRAEKLQVERERQNVQEVSSASAGLRAEIERLKAEIIRVENLRNFSDNESGKFRNEMRQRESTIEIQRTEIGELKIEIENLRAQINYLKSEKSGNNNLDAPHSAVENLSLQLSQARASGDHERHVRSAEIERLRAEIKISSETADTLKSQLRDSQTECEKLRNLLKENNRAVGEAQREAEREEARAVTAIRENGDLRRLLEQTQFALERATLTQKENRSLFADISQTPRPKLNSNFQNISPPSLPTAFQKSSREGGVYKSEFEKFAQAISAIEKEEEMLRMKCETFHARKAERQTPPFSLPLSRPLSATSLPPRHSLYEGNEKNEISFPLPVSTFHGERRTVWGEETHTQSRLNFPVDPPLQQSKFPRSPTAGNSPAVRDTPEIFDDGKKLKILDLKNSVDPVAERGEAERIADATPSQETQRQKDFEREEAQRRLEAQKQAEKERERETHIRLEREREEEEETRRRKQDEESTRLEREREAQLEKERERERAEREEDKRKQEGEREREMEMQRQRERDEKEKQERQREEEEERQRQREEEEERERERQRKERERERERERQKEEEEEREKEREKDRVREREREERARFEAEEDERRLAAMDAEIENARAAAQAKIDSERDKEEEERREREEKEKEEEMAQKLSFDYMKMFANKPADSASEKSASVGGQSYGEDQVMEFGLDSFSDRDETDHFGAYEDEF